MYIKTLHLITTSLLACALFGNVAVANDHTKTVVEHATAAAEAKGDAKAINEHADVALKHMGGAKLENANDPAALKSLLKSESDLKSAVKNANQFNTGSAGEDAAAAKARLEKLNNK
jgi:hypothetical protein